MSSIDSRMIAARRNVRLGARSGRYPLSYVLRTLAVLLCSLFAFSRGSFGAAISTFIWIAILLFSALGILLAMLLSRKMRLGLARNDVTRLSAVLMILIVLFWNNQDLDNGVYYWVVECLLYLVIYLMLSRYGDWHRTAYLSIIAAGLFYSFWTILIYLVPSVSTNFVVPFLQSRSMKVFTQGYMAGFTNHYSTNGMYLGVAVMASVSMRFFGARKTAGVRRGHHKAAWIAFFMIAISFLFCGKRGILISVICGIFVAFYIRNTRKKGLRWLILFGVVLLAILVIYIMSMVLPGVTTTFDRFFNASDTDDVKISTRFVLWSEAWAAFINKPLLGNGWFWFKYNNSVSVYHHVHNCFLQLLTEVGVVGSVPFFLFFFISLKRAIVLYKRINQGRLRLAPEAEVAIAFSLIYQVYFMVFMFEGTGLYEFQSLWPYLIACAIVQYYWRAVRTAARNG